MKNTFIYKVFQGQGINFCNPDILWYTKILYGRHEIDLK